jgi:dTDP-4-amino-4,6-dideoxygalactose transaminase
LMEVKSVKLSEKLVSQKNIFFEWRPMFSPMNIQKAFNTLIYENRTNNSLNFFNDSIFLPLHHKLYKEDIFKICDYISNLTNK